MSLSRELQPKLELAEGKTTADNAGKKPTCQGCDINEATLFCQACFEDLCNICSRSHAKYLGPDHVCGKLSDKSMVVSKLVPKSAEESPETSECVHHIGTEVSRICRQCRVLVCTKCMQNIHKDHDVVPFENAASLLMEICNQDVKLLLDALTNVHNVGSDRDSALSIDNAIQQLKQKQNDLFKMITEHVTKSIARMEEEKERFVKRATEVEEMATGTAERMEFNITQLNTARKGRDINGMVAEICRCDHIMNDVGKFVDVVGQSRSESYTVEDVLPRLREYDAQSLEMMKVFDMQLRDGHVSDTSAPRAVANITDVKAKQNLQNRSSKFKYKHLIKQRKTMLTHDQAEPLARYFLYANEPLASRSLQKITSFVAGFRHVSLVNYVSGEEQLYTSEIHITKCIHLTNDRYVTYNIVSVSLLDSNFVVLDRTQVPNDCTGICFISDSEFLLYWRHKTKPYNTFNIYQISQDKLRVKNKFHIENNVLANDEYQFCGMCPTPTKNNIVMVFTKKNESDIFIVNINSLSTNKFTISAEVFENSPYVDENGDLLVYANFQIRVYRNIENGVCDFEVLTNIKIEDGPVQAILRNENSLILGFSTKVEHYSLE